VPRRAALEFSHLGASGDTLVPECADASHAYWSCSCGYHCAPNWPPGRSYRPFHPYLPSLGAGSASIFLFALGRPAAFSGRPDVIRHTPCGVRTFLPLPWFGTCGSRRAVRGSDRPAACSSKCIRGRAGLPLSVRRKCTVPCRTSTGDHVTTYGVAQRADRVSSAARRKQVRPLICGTGRPQPHTRDSLLEDDLALSVARVLPAADNPAAPGD